MSETNAPEPTMEEILASIRRIISEDDAPAPAAAETAASPGDPPEPLRAAVEPAHPDPAPAAGQGHDAGHAQDEVLELTQRVEPEPPAFEGHEPQPPLPASHPAPPPAAAAPSSLGDLDFAAPASRDESPSRSAAAGPAAAGRRDEPLIGSGAADRAADHFGALHSSLVMPAAGRSLEDVVRELLRPMLKDWLDQHLPAIVEARVQDEVERISRRRTY